MNGQTVSFPRDANGKVTGYEQNGTLHPRVSMTITTESAALARPRPKGQDSLKIIATFLLPTCMMESLSEILRSPILEWSQPTPLSAPSSMALTKRCTASCSTSVAHWCSKSTSMATVRGAHNSSVLPPSPSSARLRASPSTAAPSRSQRARTSFEQLQEL